MSQSSFTTLSSAGIGNSLMDIMMADDIAPGDIPSYQTCKTIYLYHPMGAKLAEEPCKLAQSQERDISIPNSPEDRLKEAFINEWDSLKCNELVLRTDTVKSIYGASALIYGAHDFPTDEPIPFKKLAKLELYFNVLDPLNTSGSLITNQNPNAPDFQKHGDIICNGKQYHRSRACVVYNEQPIYISYTPSSFGYVGRSVYQRALYQLKGYIQSMITNNHVQEKAGLLIIKSKKPGSIVDQAMQAMASLKRNMLQGAKTGNVLEIGIDDSVETLNMQNVDIAMKQSRDNIIADIALAAGRPARLLSEESYTEGFGEGTEDAKAIARFIDGYRKDLKPIYDMLDPIVMARAWNTDFYLTIQNDFPEYAGIPYETAFVQWRNSFKAVWPNLLKEPDSEAIKVEEVKFKAVNDFVNAIKDDLDPENKALLFQWEAELFTELKMLFPVPLDLDFQAMAQYQEEQKLKEQEAQAQQLQSMQNGKMENDNAQ